MHQKVTNDLQQCCISCETIFSTKCEKAKVNQNAIARDFLALKWSGIHTIPSIKWLKAKARETLEEWWTAHLSQCLPQVQQITCKTCTGWNMAPSPCQSVLLCSGLGEPSCSMAELTVGPCTPCGCEMNDLTQTLLTKWHLIYHLLFVKLVPHQTVAK